MNPYKQIILLEVPKILSLLDRDEDSPTYGCFDRNFWHYKLNDYSNARMQEVCLILAFCHQDKEGEFYKNEKGKIDAECLIPIK